MIRILVWAALAIGFVELVYFSGASTFLPSPQARILTQIMVAVSIAIWVAWRLRIARPIRSPLIRPGLVYAGTVIVSAALSSKLGPSREAVALLLLALPGYLLVRDVVWHPWFGRRVDGLLVLTTVGFLASYWIQVGDQWVTWWSIVGPSTPPLRPSDVSLTIGTSNSVAAYINLLVPISAVIAWNRWHSRAVAATLVIGGVTALLVTSSRGAWLGAGAGTAAVGTVLVREAIASRQVDTHALLLRRRNAILAALAIALALLLVPVLGSRLLSGDAGRLELWRSAAEIFVAHPVFGGGPGSWPSLRATGEISEASYAVLYTAHSSIAQLAAELGIAGLLAGAFLVLTVTQIARRAVEGAHGAERTRRLSTVGSLVAIGVHSLVDPMWHVPAIVFLSFLLIARLDPPLKHELGPAARDRSGRVLALSALAVVLVGSAMLIPIDSAMVLAQTGVDRLRTGDVRGALLAYDSAISLDDRAPYRVGQAIARSYLNEREAARDDLETAWADEPYAFIEASLATLDADLGDLDGAMERARHVAASGAYDPTAELNAAAVLWSGGDKAAGEDALAGVFETVPGLLPSDRPVGTFDATTWSRAQLEAIDRLGETSPGVAAYWAVNAGNVPAADVWQRTMSSGPDLDAIILLRRAESGGTVTTDEALAVLRRAPSSPVVLACVDRIGALTSAPRLSDAAKALSIEAHFNVPAPLFMVVLDGAHDPGLLLRLPRWPNASDSRLGPDRPYVAGMLTIEGAP